MALCARSRRPYCAFKKLDALIFDLFLPVSSHSSPTDLVPTVRVGLQVKRGPHSHRA